MTKDDGDDGTSTIVWGCIAAQTIASCRGLVEPAGSKPFPFVNKPIEEEASCIDTT